MTVVLSQLLCCFPGEVWRRSWSWRSSEQLTEWVALIQRQYFGHLIRWSQTRLLRQTSESLLLNCSPTSKSCQESSYSKHTDHECSTLSCHHGQTPDRHGSSAPSTQWRQDGQLEEPSQASSTKRNHVVRRPPLAQAAGSSEESMLALQEISFAAIQVSEALQGCVTFLGSTKYWPYQWYRLAWHCETTISICVCCVL